MIVFKTYLKILNKKRTTLILYTAIMMAILVLSFRTTASTGEFVSRKPSITVINHDRDSALSRHFVAYLKGNTVIEEVENIRDALFYQQISCVIEIPEGFHDRIMSRQKPILNITTADSQESGLSRMVFESYLRMASTLAHIHDRPEQVIKALDATLATKINAEMLDASVSSGLDKAVKFFNSANYTILMCGILVITTVMLAFKQEAVFKRTMISSMRLKRYQRLLTLSNGVYALLLGGLYIALSILFVGPIMWSPHGLLYMLNLLVFIACVLVMALLVSNLINGKNAVEGVVNVIGLGSSFLCGAFVPMRFLPEQVLSFARLLPSYWYVRTNEMIYELKRFDFEYLKPILFNELILIAFTVLFLIINRWVAHKKRVTN